MVIDAAGQAHAPAGTGARIVSLVPSVTELLCELGLAAQLVGRTGFCIHPRATVRAIPKLGGTKDVDFDALAAVRPSHVIVNIDENTHPTYERLRTLVPHVVVTHPNAPADNLELYRLLGTIFGREREMQALSRDFRAALARIEDQRSRRPPQRVVYLIWRQPWMTVSSDTYIAGMLRLVNWHTVPDLSTRRYPELSAEEVRAQAADLYLLSSEPYPFRDKHLDELGALTGRRERVHLIDGEMVSWYGSRAIAGLAYLARFAGATLGSPA